jgi:Zn-dependent protease with chaperone function
MGRRNLILALLYVTLNAAVFLALQTVGVIAPGWLTFEGVLLIDPSGKFMNQTKFVVLGGMLASGLSGFNALRALKITFSIPDQGSKLHDSRILSLVSAVTDAVGVSAFRAVYLDAGPNFSTFHVGPGRYLRLGAVALAYLTPRELGAIVAHECGHHHHHSMMIHRFHYRAVIMYYGYAQALMWAGSGVQKVPDAYGFLKIGAAIGLIPIGIALRLYRCYLMAMSHLVGSAKHEYYCDSVAVQYAGITTFESALWKVFDLQLAAAKLRESDLGYEPMGSYLEKLDLEYRRLRDTDSPERAAAASRPSQTHPAVTDRLRRAGVIAGLLAGGEDELSGPVLSVVEVRSLLERLAMVG